MVHHFFFLISHDQWQANFRDQLKVHMQWKICLEWQTDNKSWTIVKIWLVIQKHSLNTGSFGIQSKSWMHQEHMTTQLCFINTISSKIQCFYHSKIYSLYWHYTVFRKQPIWFSKLVKQQNCEVSKPDFWETFNFDKNVP